MNRIRKSFTRGRFYLLMVVVFVLCFATQGIAQEPARTKADPKPESEVADLTMQLAKVEEHIKAMDEHLRRSSRFSVAQVSRYDFISTAATTIDRLADSLTGVTDQKKLDALLAASAKTTDMSVSLKGISDGATHLSAKDSPEDLRKALAAVVESTNKSGMLVKEIEAIIKMTPDQVADKLKKDGFLLRAPEMTPPKTFDKSKQGIAQAELDALIAQNKVVKTTDLNDLLKPDERQITSGKSGYIKMAYRSLSKELKLLYTGLRDADRAVSADTLRTGKMLRDENAKRTFLKTELTKYPAEGGQTK